MPVVSCPKCSTGLRVPDGSVVAVRCPKCQTVFSPPQPKPAAPAFEVVEEAPPPAAPKKAFSLDDAVRSADTGTRRSARDDRDDEDDRRDRDRDRRGRRDEDDDRPRSRRDRDRDWDDDEDDDRDRDRPRKASKYGLARPGVLLLLISLSLYIGGVGLLAVFALLEWTGVDVPNGLGVMTGVLGLSGWVVALVGLGLVIAGPRRSRGLAIAAISVSAVHLILALVVANRNTGGEMRWEVMTTTLPLLDNLIAELAYNAKAFDQYVWSLLAGMLELARLILVGLLLGSLAAGAKDHRAEAQAKFGWIAGSAAVGVAMLVVLLAQVIGQSALRDAIRGSAPPSMSFTTGRDFRQQQQEFDTWQREQQNRLKSIQRTARFWTYGRSLLVTALHTGTLVLPLLASLGVYQSMGRRR